MKARASTLNPYAASYVPLNKREAVDENKDCKLLAEGSLSGNEGVYKGPDSQHATKSQQQIAEDSNLKGNLVHGFYGSSSQNPSEVTKKQTTDEEFHMDLAYLQMLFPGISDDSIFSVYLATKGDLEATVDMLDQLELDTFDSYEKLPATLDIGDVPQPGSSSNHTSEKLKQVADEIDVSPSCSLDSAPVSPN